MENNNVSDGESPGELSMLLLSRLTKHRVAESVSAVMRASMALNWLQLKTGFHCCWIRFQFATTFRKGKKMVEYASPQGSECPVARTLEAIGDRWSLMIIRDAFDDIRRFSEFQKSLGVARNILASRLKTLVEVGIFEVRPASDGSAYKEYVLTEKGREIFPVVISMRQWGERFLFGPQETRSVLLDNASGQALMPIEVRSSSGQKLGPADCHRVRWVDGDR